MILEPGHLVRGKYRIIRLIGDGGMGAVYEAQHELLKTTVALKFLHSDLAERTGLADRFLVEARVSATINNPHVARVTDVDSTEEGTPFLVMELLRGESLQDLMDRQPVLSEGIVVEFARQILTGLQAAHQLQVVHRDLKPDNVFITNVDGLPRLKLIDFGIAKLRGSPEFQRDLTRAGAMMGTPEYMAPEQLYEARDVDARADLYSLGVIMYEMLSGARPADGDDAAGIIAAVVAGRVRPLRERNPEVSEALSKVIHRAIEAERADRFESSRSMLRALAPLERPLSDADLDVIGTRKTTAELPAMGNDEPSRVAQQDGQVAVPATLRPDDDPPDTEDDLGVGEKTEDAAPLALPGAAPPPSVAAIRAAAPSASVLPRTPASPPRPARRNSSVLVLILVLLLVGLGSAIALVLVTRGGTSSYTDLPPTDLTRIESPPPATAIPEVPATPPINTPPSPPTRHTPPKTGGTRPSAPPVTGTPEAPPPISFPSALPPLPSRLPPLPSGFPTAIPSFFPQIPGLTPPASSAKGRSENE